MIVDFNPFAGMPGAPVYIPEPEPVGPTALTACTACDCRKEARQVVPGVGPLDARMLILGSTPGDEEDVQGRPFMGGGGRELNDWLKILGLRREKMALTYAVKCHTRENRPPKVKEQKMCSDLWLGPELAEWKDVQVIFPIGKPAAVAILGKAAPPLTPLLAHHYKIRVHGREIRVFPLPHPAYFLRARHHVTLFKETVLSHVKLTLLKDAGEAYIWSSGA